MQEEFKRCSRFSLGIALDMYPIMTCDSNEAPNLYQAKVRQHTDNVYKVGIQLKAIMQ
jgi:hypothetical protein